MRLPSHLKLLPSVILLWFLLHISVTSFLLYTNKRSKNTLEKNMCSYYNKNKHSVYEVILMKGSLLNAAETGERLEMIYMSEKGKISQRIIKVLNVEEGSIKADP